MALNNFKCNYLTPLHFKGLIRCYYLAVCLGFTSCKTLILTNTSDIPLNFHAYVPNDGSQPPICFDQPCSCECQCDNKTESDEPNIEVVCEETLGTKPKEFTVEPSCGVLQPKSEVEFTVSLCPNSMAKYCRDFAVNFAEVANETFAVPITAQYASSLCIHCCSTVQYLTL